MPFWLYISFTHEEVRLKEQPTFTTVHVCKVLQLVQAYKQYNNGCHDIQNLFMLLLC